MSFTLMRYKDGKPVPIKVSVWDAFRGVPPPKPRLHQCSSCNSFHGPANTAQVKSEQGKKSDVAENAKPEKKGDTEESSFTKEEDAKIVQMKSDGKTWAEIAKEVGGGRHKSDVSRRWKEVNAKDGADKSETKESSSTKEKDGKEKEKNAQSNEAKMTKKEKKAAKAQHDREEGLKRQDEQKNKDQAEATEGDAESKNSTTENAATKGKANEKTDTAAATNIKTPKVKDEKQKWIATASKHFDRTGQRLTVEQARKMTEEKST